VNQTLLDETSHERRTKKSPDESNAVGGKIARLTKQKIGSRRKADGAVAWNRAGCVLVVWLSVAACEVMAEAAA
jgi:hypothetical protein